MKVRTYKENVLLLNPPVRDEFINKSLELKSVAFETVVNSYDKDLCLQEEFQCNYNEYHENGFFRYWMSVRSHDVEIPHDRQILVPRSLIKAMTDYEPILSDVLIEQFDNQLKTASFHSIPLLSEIGQSLQIKSSKFEYTFAFYSCGKHVLMNRLEIEDLSYDGFDHIRTHYAFDKDDFKVITTKVIIKRDSRYKVIDKSIVENISTVDALDSDREMTNFLLESLPPQIEYPFELCKNHFAVKLMIDCLGENDVIEIFNNLIKRDSDSNSMYYLQQDESGKTIRFNVSFWNNQLYELNFNYVYHKNAQKMVHLESRVDSRIVEKIKELNPNNHNEILEDVGISRQYSTVYQNSEECTLREIDTRSKYNVDVDYEILLNEVYIYSLTYSLNSTTEKTSDATKVFIDKNDEVQVSSFKKRNPIYKVEHLI